MIWAFLFAGIKSYLNIQISMQFSTVFLHIEVANAVTARCWLLLEIVKRTSISELRANFGND